MLVFISIHDRSKNIDNRKSLGHWEGDLVSGSNKHAHCYVSRQEITFYHNIKLAAKDDESVHAALLSTLKKMPAEYRKSLTWDRGMKLSKHADLTKQFPMPHPIILARQ